MQRDNSGELKVFISAHESACDECREDLGDHAWITLAGEMGALCLACADLAFEALSTGAFRFGRRNPLSQSLGKPRVLFYF